MSNAMIQLFSHFTLLTVISDKERTCTSFIKLWSGRPQKSTFTFNKHSRSYFKSLTHFCQTYFDKDKLISNKSLKEVCH